MSDLMKKYEFGFRLRLLQELMDTTMKDVIEKSDPNKRQPKKKYKKKGKLTQSDHQQKHSLDETDSDTKCLVDSLVQLEILNEADAKLIRGARNKIAHNRLNFSEREFMIFYDSVKDVILRLGCDEAKYESIRTCSLDSKRIQQRYCVQIPILDFFGRTEELERFHTVVEEMLKDPSVKDTAQKNFGVVVISGKASIGKSQFVWNYLHQRLTTRSKSEIMNVFCVDASTWFSLDQSLRSLANYLNFNIKIGESLTRLLVRLSNRFSKHTIFLFENFTLVVDDDDITSCADNKFENLMNTLSMLDSSVLITTRFCGEHWKKYSDYVHEFPLDGFSPVDAVAFVKRELEKSKDSPRKESLEGDSLILAIDYNENELLDFVRKCEYHPLLLSNTLKFLCDSKLNCATEIYKALVEWNRSFSEVYHSTVDKNIHAREALIVSLKQYKAYEFLKIISILNCCHLKREVLQLYAPIGVDFECMLHHLQQISVLRACYTEHDVEDYFVIPSIELQTTRSEIDVAHAKKCFEVMFKDLETKSNAHLDGVWDLWCEHFFSVFEQFKRHSNVFHVFVIKTYAFRDELTAVFERKGATCHWQDVLVYLCNTQYKVLLRELQEMRLKLVDCYIKEGYLSAADELLLKITNQWDGSLEEYPDLKFQVKFEQARCFKEMGRLQESMCIFHEIKPLASDSRRTEVLNGIQVCLRKSGRYQEAKDGYLKLLKSLNRTGRPDYMTRGNLALCMQRLRQFEKADKIYSEILRIQEDYLGTLHPNYLNTLSNRAACLHECGRLDEALQRYDELLIKQCELFGSSSQVYLTTILWKGEFCLYLFLLFFQVYKGPDLH